MSLSMGNPAMRASLPSREGASATPGSCRMLGTAAAESPALIQDSDRMSSRDSSPAADAVRSGEKPEQTTERTSAAPAADRAAVR